MYEYCNMGLKRVNCVQMTSNVQHPQLIGSSKTEHLKCTIQFSTTSFRAYLETWKSQSVFPTLLGPSSISFFVF